MDALILSRWQFAITTVYHFLFVPVTLGLSIFVALLETCYVRTRRPAWKETSRKLVRFFGTLFIINFSMGVVTGIVQEFHFGLSPSRATSQPSGSSSRTPSCSIRSALSSATAAQR